MGCVITNKSTVISVSCNKLKFNKRFCNPVKRYHAEALAIRLAGRDSLSGCTVYVYREDKKGKPKIAKPCIDCERLLKERNVKKVIYSVEEFPYFEVMYL